MKTQATENALGELLITDVADVDQMNERYDRDGYLLFRGVLDKADVDRVKQDITQVLERQGLVKKRADEPIWSGAGYDQIDDEALYSLDSCIALYSTVPMRRLLEQVFGEPAFIARCVTIRFALPADPAHVSAAHQDGFYVRGISELRTLWVPLMAVDRSTAPLAVAAGSHKRGMFVHEEQQHLWSYVLKGRKQSGIHWQEEDLDWLTTDFEPGDVLMFHRQTVHRALPNCSDRIRLSLDTRCHPQSIPATFQNTCTILELRQYRQRAHEIATNLGASQDVFEKLILEMMERGTPTESEAILTLLEELNKDS